MNDDWKGAHLLSAKRSTDNMVAKRAQMPKRDEKAPNKSNFNKGWKGKKA